MNFALACSIWRLQLRIIRCLVITGLFLWLFSALTASAVVPWNILINTNYILNVTNYGAVGDGVTTNTTAIQNAINAATAGGKTNGLIGGTVKVPAGIFLSGPLVLKNNVNLQVDSGAMLRMLPFGSYPVSWFTNGGTNVYFVSSADFISASSMTNIEVSGPGAIDGQGLPWWPWANTNNAARPVMIRFTSCNYQLIQNLTLSNSPMFHLAFSSSKGNITVQNVTIRAPSSGATPPSHNTDACDVSGTNILVQNNDISTGDDNFTCGGATSDILISNNIYGYGHGVSIGSYTSPYVSNMLVINCSFNNTDQGIRIKSDRDRGGFVHNINYCNLTMTNVMRPILIYCQYTNTTPAYRA
jgi:polygalacturonase